MEYTKAIKKRDQLENELKSIEWKIHNASKIETNMKSWYNKKEDEYKNFLDENKLKPLNITLLIKPDN